MKIKIQITSWISGSVLFEYEIKDNTIKKTLEEARRQGANLQDANLRGANLWDANLQGANLWGANLQDANLRGANLWDANLQGANLRGANLQDANLRGANLWDANLQGANLWGANLRGANLQGANLWGANLQDANLQGANLWDANLQGANLWGANLQDANLRGANLWGAKNLPNKFHNSLNILRYQTGKLKAYKYLRTDMSSPYNGLITYKVGKIYKLDEFDVDDRVLCSTGLNIASLEWCVVNRENYEDFIEVEFDVKDVVSIPYNSDGKFRVKRLKVLRHFKLKEAKEILEKILPLKMKTFEYKYYKTMEEVRKHIQECEGRCSQQVAYSSFHDCLTQICFSCRKIRTNKII